MKKLLILSLALLCLTNVANAKVISNEKNIPYIIVKDKGLWTPDYNPEIYRGVNPGKTPSENVIALDQIGPNGKYTNRYEGKGNSSYSTTNGNSINLSKNVEAPI